MLLVCMCDGTEQFHTIIREGEVLLGQSEQVACMQQCPASKLTIQHTHLIGNCSSCVTIFSNQFNQTQSTSTVMFSALQPDATLMHSFTH